MANQQELQSITIRCARRYGTVLPHAHVFAPCQWQWQRVFVLRSTRRRTWRQCTHIEQTVLHVRELRTSFIPAAAANVEVQRDARISDGYSAECSVLQLDADVLLLIN